MNILLPRSAAALLMLTPAAPALAQDNSDQPITVAASLPFPTAGVMNSHIHDGGEVMIGLSYQRITHSGDTRSGTDRIADADILAAGYTTRTQRMVMDMVMIDIMFAPTDDFTLMVMPHWMRHEMTMVGIDPANTGEMEMDGMDMTHSHHAIPFGETMTHSVEGFGDTLFAASYRLARSADFNAHATLGIWAPTGKVDRKNPDGRFVHYAMQSGSGTWDVEPSLTLSGNAGDFGWGAQASYRWRGEDANESGFAFGDRAQASIWASRLLSPTASATGRLGWEHESQISGHYNGAHNHSAPPDRQANYGGDTVLAAIGFNWVLPVGGKSPPQLGVEAGVPLYKNLNGIQLPESWRMAVALNTVF